MQVNITQQLLYKKKTKQIQNLLMRSIGIVRTAEHTSQYAGHLLQRVFVHYFSLTL